MPYNGLRTVNALAKAVGEFKQGKAKLLCSPTGPFITMEGQIPNIPKVALMYAMEKVGYAPKYHFGGYSPHSVKWPQYNLELMTLIGFQNCGVI